MAVFWFCYWGVLGVAMALCCFCCSFLCASFMSHSVRVLHWIGSQFSGGARVGSSIMHL